MAVAVAGGDSDFDGYGNVSVDENDCGCSSSCPWCLVAT